MKVIRKSVVLLQNDCESFKGLTGPIFGGGCCYSGSCCQAGSCCKSC